MLIPWAPFSVACPRPALAVFDCVSGLPSSAKGKQTFFIIAILVRPLDVQAKRLSSPSLSQCPICQTKRTASPGNRRKGEQTRTYLDAPSVRHLPNGRAPSPSCQCERQINNLRLATAPVPHLPNEKAPRASCNKSTIIRGL